MVGPERIGEQVADQALLLHALGLAAGRTADERRGQRIEGLGSEVAQFLHSPARQVVVRETGRVLARTQLHEIDARQTLAATRPIRAPTVQVQREHRVHPVQALLGKQDLARAEGVLEQGREVPDFLDLALDRAWGCFLGLSRRNQQIRELVFFIH